MLSTLDLHYLGRERVIAAALLEGPDGRAAIVDPGPATGLDALRAGLAARGRSLGDIDAILLTHIHLDHAGATGTILRECPGIPVYVHERGAPHLVDPSRLLKSAAVLYGEDMARLWGEVAPVPEADVRVLRGGERIEAGGVPLRVEYSPGHASHHVSYLDEGTGTAFVGDTAGIRVGAPLFVLPPTPPPDIDLPAWDASLRLIADWRPQRLFLTHFGAFDSAAEHLAATRDSLAAQLEIARTVYDRPARDDGARMEEFCRRVSAWIAGQAGAEWAEACSRAVPLGHCWLGLSRYLTKRERTA
jgi:glyoxylase-like metal-dependent hydrolase (beta-lactamase superfamily II)